MSWLATILIGLSIIYALYIFFFQSRIPIHVKVERRLPIFSEFFTLLSDDKTANHIGSSQMKTLRGMLDHTIAEIDPAVLRGWARALRKKAGTLSHVRAQTGQLQESDDGSYSQMVVDVEFLPLFLDDDAEKKKEEEQQKKEITPVVVACLLQFRSSEKKQEGEGEGDYDKNGKLIPIREKIRGFHCLPAVDDNDDQQQQQDDEEDKGNNKKDKNKNKNNNTNKPPFLDIISHIVPSELDQFCERAIEGLFEPKNKDDPMTGMFDYCVKPLRDLYDVTSSSASSADDNTGGAGGGASSSSSSSSPSSPDNNTNNNNNLTPRERRTKLATDVKDVKSLMGFVSDGSSSFVVTMTAAELDTQLFPNVKSICTRVTITGTRRDCVITLYVLVDLLSKTGFSIAKYQFGIGPDKQRTMLFDQDNNKMIGSS